MTGMTPTMVSGRVTRVLYADPGESYTVLEVETDQGPAVWTVPMGGLAPGQEVQGLGSWRTHPRHGRQFRAVSVVVLPPSRREGLRAWLSSDQVPGIGPRLADRLLECFGDDLPSVIEAGVEDLARCPGVGTSKASRIVEAWRREKAHRETFVLLCEMGLTPSQAQRLIRAHGPEAPARVRLDPWSMAREVPGIGFHRADAMAARIGIAPDSPLRLRASVMHVMGQSMEEGHLFLPRDQVVRKASDLTGQAPVLLEMALDGLVAGGDLIQEHAPEGALVYLVSLHRAEVDAVRRLALLSEAPVLDLPLEAAAEAAPGLASSQREALGTLCSHAVAVLTGGPGTGKTTLVKALCGIADRRGLRMALAAPTGRAAMRLRESTGREARTLHRLLEFHPREDRFLRDEFHPLEVDWVVVDECSMLDAWLLDRLLRALAPGTRLTLVGDADQIPPVGPGDPFRAMVQSGVLPVACLREVFRQGEGSGIVRAARDILEGREPAPGDDPRSAGDDFHLVIREDPGDAARMVERLVVERIPARFGLDPATQVQVLSPMHRGECGTEALNRRIRDRLNPGAPGRLAPGDRVVQVRNNYDLEVFNGDIGRIEERTGDGGIVVRFEDRRVSYGPEEAGDLAWAHALTIHKSQGSEFPAVVVALSTQHWVMLRRALVYTAVTRGRRLVVLVGSRRALRAALDNARQEPRNTRMLQRMQAAMSGPRDGVTGRP